MTTVRDVIQRDLDEDIQSVIKVAEEDRLTTDLREYVLTDDLAKQFADVFSATVAAARPASGNLTKVGIWVSGFFGSGKSHFSKLIGHLAADTETPAGTARELFKQRLTPGNPRHDDLAGLLQEAENYGLRAFVVPFDITATYGDATDSPARIALRAFQAKLGLSSLIPFADLELELIDRGKYEQLLKAYQARESRPWSEDKELPMQSFAFASCLAELMPDKYPSAEVAHESLNMVFDQFERASASDVVQRLLRWLNRQAGADNARTMIFFVADEVGAWAGRNLDRIEQVRALVEQFDKEASRSLRG